MSTITSQSNQTDNSENHNMFYCIAQARGLNEIRPGVKKNHEDNKGRISEGLVEREDFEMVHIKVCIKKAGSTLKTSKNSCTNTSTSPSGQ